MPYQNNSDTVDQIAKALMNNIKQKNYRFKKLIYSFDYYGFGKTRLGVQFLDLWKKKVETQEYYKKEMEKDREAFDTLYKTKLHYVDVRSLENLQEFKKKIEPPNNFQFYFIVIDELPAFAEKLVGKGKPYETIPQAIYRIWVDYIFDIQKIDKVVGIYVCGKGTIIRSFGKSMLRHIDTVSPTESEEIKLHSLKDKDIENIINSYENISNLKDKIENEKNVFKYLKDRILEESGGIPLIVTELVDQIEKILKNSGEKTSNLIQLIDHSIDEIMTSLDERFLKPWNPYSSEKAPLELFKIMFLYTELNISLKADHMIHIYENDLLKDSKYFQEFQKIDLKTAASILNCYVEENDEGELQIIFPKRTKQYFVKECDITPMIVPYFINQIPGFIDKGNIFEIVVGYLISFKINAGAIQNQKIIDIFSFFNGIKELSDLKCAKLELKHSNMKMIVATQKKYWNELLSNEENKNKLLCFEDKSTGCDQVIILKNDNNQNIILGFQYKNLKQFDLTELLEEFSKIKSQLEHIVNENSHFVYTFIYSCKVDKLKSLYNAGETIGKGNIKQFIVPKNMTVVIIHKENYLIDIIGTNNLKAIEEFREK